MNSMILKSASFATRVPLSSRSHSRDHSHTCRAQELQGRVVSTSANNTTIVAVENVSVHPLYVLRAIRGTLSAGPRPGHPTHVSPFVVSPPFPQVLQARQADRSPHMSR
jgi:hypothetical protein